MFLTESADEISYLGSQNFHLGIVSTTSAAVPYNRRCAKELAPLTAKGSELVVGVQTAPWRPAWHGLRTRSQAI